MRIVRWLLPIGLATLVSAQGYSQTTKTRGKKKKENAAAQEKKQEAAEQKNIDDVIKEKKADIPKVESDTQESKNAFIKPYGRSSVMMGFDMTDLKGLHLEFDLSYAQISSQDDLTNTAATISSKANLSGFGLTGNVAYGLSTSPVKFGAGLTKSLLNGKSTYSSSGSADQSFKLSNQGDNLFFQTSFYPVSEFEIAVFYSIEYTRTQTSPDTGDSSVSATTFTHPAIILGYHGKNGVHTRLAYTPKSDRSDDNNPGNIDPSEIQLEGTFRISPAFDWHVLLDQTKYSDENYDKNGLKNSDHKDVFTITTGPWTKLAPNMGLDFDVSYRPQTGTPDSTLPAELASELGFHPKFFMEVAPLTTVMAALDYASSSRSVTFADTSTRKHSQSSLVLTFGVTHRM